MNNAYKVAISMTRCNLVAKNSHRVLQSSFWRKIWNLHIPNKIKLFTWRACQDILPTKDNLYHRHVLNTPTCRAYTLAPKTMGHLFWVTKKVWSISDIPFDSNGLSFMHFKDFLWHVIFKQHMTTELIELTVTTT